MNWMKSLAATASTPTPDGPHEILSVLLVGDLATPAHAHGIDAKVPAPRDGYLAWSWEKVPHEAVRIRDGAAWPILNARPTNDGGVVLGLPLSAEPRAGDAIRIVGRTAPPDEATDATNDEAGAAGDLRARGVARGVVRHHREQAETARRAFDPAGHAREAAALRPPRRTDGPSTDDPPPR